MDLLSQAIKWHYKGLNVILVKGNSKVAAGRWAKWGLSPQREYDVVNLIQDSSKSTKYNIGLVCGMRSRAVPENWGYFTVIDCDDLSTLERVYELIKEKVRAEVPRVISARGGHLWLRTKFQVKTKRLNGLNAEVKGFMSYVLSPGSLHPVSGHVYELVGGFCEIPFVDDAIDIGLEYQETVRLTRLSKAIFVNNSKVILKYKTRSEVDRALILSLCNLGLPYNRVEQIYLLSSHKKHLDSDKEDFRKRMRAEYERALYYVKKENRGNEERYLLSQKIRQWVLDGNYAEFFNSRFKETFGILLLIHSDVASLSKKSSWHLAVRDVWLWSGLSFMTVVGATKKLIEGGFLKLNQSSIGRLANVYGWGEKVMKVCRDIECDGRDVRFNRFLHYALPKNQTGRVALYLYHHLLRDPKTLENIVIKTGYKYSTVVKAVDLLIYYGLIVQDGVYLSANPDIESILRRPEIYEKVLQSYRQIESERAIIRPQ